MKTMKRSMSRGILAACVALSLVSGAPVASAAPEGEVLAPQSAPLSFKERVANILAERDAAKAKAEDLRKARAREESERASAAARERAVSERQETEARYSYDWQGTPLNQTLYAIGKMADKKIVINGELSGTVYTSLRDVTFDEALNYLSQTFNFNWQKQAEGDTVLISTGDMLRQSKRFEVRYASKDQIKEELKALGIEEKNIFVNSQYNSVSVTGTPYQLAMAQRRVIEMDKPVSQCLIVAQLVELSHGKSLDLGLKYALPTYTHEANSDGSTSTLKGNFLEKLTFSASAEASRALRKGKVVARPMVMTLNGQEALISMGDRVPVLSSTTTNVSTEMTVTYEDIGSKLKVTPVIDKATGNIGLTIETEISTIAKWITQGAVSAPQIASRKAVTTAHLQSGQSLVIGGLMTSSDIKNLSGIPGLMDLPILGQLFKSHSTSKEHTEIFIMLTPYIVGEGVDPEAILKKEI